MAYIRCCTVLWSLSAIVVALLAVGLTLEAFFPEDDNYDMLFSHGSLPPTGYPEYAATNPYRDLPQDLAVHATLRELLYIHTVLRDMLPTTLPDEDDYELYSRLLHSLETREDISYLAAHETGIARTIMAIANRRPSAWNQPIADEPFDLQGPAERLHHHWRTQEGLPGAPQRWEAAFDTTFYPPLLKSGEDEVDEEKGEIRGKGQQADDATPLSLTPEQAAQADKEYAQYRERRDRQVSYLKLHPPKPMAWVPITTPASPDGGGGGEDDGSQVRGAWESVLPDGDIRAGRNVDGKRLADSPQWRPIYRDLMTENVPIGWVDPDAPVKSEEEARAELEAYIAVYQAESEVREGRRQRQLALQERLKEERQVRR